MGKKVKWALLTMLGFATACSTVKNAPQGAVSYTHLDVYKRQARSVDINFIMICK